LWKTIIVIVMHGLMCPPDVAEQIVRARMIPTEYAAPTVNRAVVHQPRIQNQSVHDPLTADRSAREGAEDVRCGCCAARE
jgi:hypothetical protein